jgi:large subunit ribosomal protein L24
MFKTKLKKGDQVIVNSGKHKGSTGKITKIITSTSRCIIEGVALVKKHQRATKQGEKSQIISKESSVHISNVQYYDDKAKKAVKLSYRKDDNGKKVRVNRKSGEVVNG